MEIGTINNLEYRIEFYSELKDLLLNLQRDLRYYEDVRDDSTEGSETRRTYELRIQAIEELASKVSRITV